ncbi:MAG TPA: hypothetical protein VIU81_08410 [Gaiellaceae bacterium]
MPTVEDDPTRPSRGNDDKNHDDKNHDDKNHDDKNHDHAGPPKNSP